MSPLGSRSLLRGASRLTSMVPKRSMATKKAPAAGKSEQVHPIGAYYEAIMTKPQPLPKVKAEVPPTTSAKSTRGRKSAAARKNPASRAGPSANLHRDRDLEDDSHDPVDPAAAPAPSSPPTLSAEPATAQEKARIIFGSRLAGPEDRAERLKATRNRSTRIAGVLVPPKPEEPDNCCMSGCVNCVWDLFRDEMEDWVAANAEVERRLKAEKPQGAPEVPGGVSAIEGSKGPGSGGTSRPQGAETDTVSMDDDGGGSETNWPVEQQPQISKDFWDDQLYKGVPVGIREFMKTEKKLKQRHEQEGTVGG